MVSGGLASDTCGSLDFLLGNADAYQAGELATCIYCMIGYRHTDEMLAAGVR